MPAWDAVTQTCPQTRGRLTAGTVLPHTYLHAQGHGGLKLISFKACDTLIRGSHQDKERTAGPCMHKEMTFESCVLCVLRHRPGSVPNTSLQARSPGRTARVVAPGPSEPPSPSRAASAILGLISHRVTPSTKCEELGVGAYPQHVHRERKHWGNSCFYRYFIKPSESRNNWERWTHQILNRTPK